MKYFSSSLIAYFICINAGICAYLPVVDVSRGDISARAAFGEEIIPQNKVAVAPVEKKEKKVVVRTAKKTVAPTVVADVLKPNRPSSDLWARGGENSLRMPRMDEIAVIKSDALLPEESLNSTPVKVAAVQKNVAQRVSRDEAMEELKQLRAEVARLAQLQQEAEIARARPIAVRTPISGDTSVKPKNNAEPARDVSVRRSVVAMETPKQVAGRSATSTVAEPMFSSVKNDMSKMSPNELKKAFKKTYLSENKHLSTYQIDDRFDTASDMSFDVEGFSAARDLSELDGGVRPMEIKISFLNGDSGLTRDNYDILTQTASIVVNNPKRAIQIAIPESATHTKDSRKLAAKRLAIVEQVLRDTGIAEQRIVPVLSQRDSDDFVLRVISGDVFESLREQKRNMFGDTVSTKTYKSMSW